MSEQSDKNVVARALEVALAHLKAGRLDEADVALEAARHEALHAPALVRASVVSALGEIRLRQARFDEAEQMFGEALKLQSDEIGFENPIVPLTLLRMADVYEARGNPEEAEPPLRLAVTILENLGLDALQLIDLHRRIASLRVRLGVGERAVDALVRALQIADVSRVEASVTLAVLRDLVGASIRAGQPSLTAQSMRRCLEIEVELHGKTSVEAARASLEMAVLLLGEGQAAEAAALAAQALLGFEEEAHHIERVRCLNVQLMACLQQRRSDHAERLVETLQSLQEKRYGAASEECLRLLLVRAVVIAPERSEEALNDLRKGLRRLRSREWSGELLADYLSALTELQLSRRALGPAARYALEARAERERDPRSHKKAEGLLLLGRVRLEQGDPAQADEAVTQALALFRAHAGHAPVKHAQALEMLGDIRLAEELPQETRRAWEAAIGFRAANCKTDHDGMAALLLKAARLEVQLGHEVAAIRLLRRAGSHLASSSWPSPRLAADIAWLLARSLVVLDDTAEVERLYREAIRCLEEVEGPGHADVLRCRSELDAFTTCRR